MILPYDKENPKSIEQYAKKLIGKTFHDVLSNEFDGEELEKMVDYYNNPKGKGSLGNLLEEHYFFYKPNSVSEPDFYEAGTELKVSPYEITKGHEKRAGERLVITMIPNDSPISEIFEESHLYKKIRLMLLILYNRIKKNPRLQHKIDFVTLFSILGNACKEDLEVIREDYESIVKKILSGKAHELSEGDTRYLGACTKGGTAESSLKPQYYNKEILAKRRAFSLKQSYMTYVLNHYILNETEIWDSIFSEKDLNQPEYNFDKEVLKKINAYKGKSEKELYQEFDISIGDFGARAKQANSQVISRLLGIKTDKAAEFEKANIEIKTIRIQKNGLPKESMSFPKIIIKKFVEEKFEDSELYHFFSEKRFLFIVFREGEDYIYRLSGAQFWNMPIVQLETIVKKEWEDYQKKFIEGVVFTVTSNSKGKEVIKNDLAKKTETEIIHLRPHSKKAAYEISEKRYGNGNDSDMDLLPNNDRMTHQCFWLNNTYVADIVKEIV